MHHLDIRTYINFGTFFYHKFNETIQKRPQKGDKQSKKEKHNTKQKA
jgi:hypothetical protein